MKPLPWPVVLASASPRRQSLLRDLVAEFEVLPAEVDEESLTVEDPWQTAQGLAREKAFAVFARRTEALVIAGDTVVTFQEGDRFHQLAKPKGEEGAMTMLRTLAGRTHTVITGVCLRWPKGMSAFTDETRVTFKELTDSEIEDYVAAGESMDKAGAYGLQGKAKSFVERIDGSKSNVIGLPVEKLEEALKQVR